MSVGSWCIRIAIIKCVVDVSRSPFVASDDWLVRDLRGGVLVQPYILWMYHVGSARYIFIPYLDTYVIGPTIFTEQGNLVRVYVFLPVVDLYDLVGRWLEDGEARVGLLPTSS